MVRKTTLATCAVVAFLISSACGEQGTGGREQAGASDAEPSEAPVPESTSEPTVGSVRFAVDGVEKHFAHVPESGARYLPLASTIRAHPSAGATEQLAIIIQSIDLREVDYPANLPPAKDFSQPMSAMAAMATVGFSYVDPDGVEWAGPGEVWVESFDPDGTIEGTFDGTSLPHTDERRGAITITGGTFRARIAGG